MCVDATVLYNHNSDFEGFILTEYDDVVQELTPKCNEEEDWISVDLTEKRLIGFKVIESDYTDGRRNLRSIQVITDTPACDDTQFKIDTIQDMSQVIGTG